MERKQIEAAARMWLERKGYIGANEREKTRLMTDFALSLLSDRWTEIKGAGLPKESGEYLVTRRMNILVVDVLAFYRYDKRRGFWGGCVNDVIAWQPLPAPFTPPTAEGGEK
jgi:hypothetical protein